MTPAGALFVTLGLLLAPWILMPRRSRREIHGFVRVLWHLNAFYCHFWHRLVVVGKDPLPDVGAAILVSNHTCCIDHMLLQAATERLLGFMIAKELYDYWLFTALCATAGCIPVRRDGRDLSAMRAALRALGEGRVLPIFPEGKIYPTSGRSLGDGKPGVAYLALKASVPVIPAFICGTPPTNNILRSYLSPSRSCVVFGEPIDLSDLRGDAALERENRDEDIRLATDRLMAALTRLRDATLGPSSPVESNPIPVSRAELHASTP